MFPKHFFAGVVCLGLFIQAQVCMAGYWHPEIGVMADVLLRGDSLPIEEDEEDARRIRLREVEIMLGSPVDEYSHFDVTLGIEDLGVPAIEEAYLTRTGLPMVGTARIGRFLPKIGRAIAVHQDTLDTVDEPMVIEKYFGHHGFHKTGVDLTQRLTLPWPVEQDVTLGVLEGGNGEEGTLFGETRRRPTLYAHLQNGLDLHEDAEIEIGLTYVTGSRDADSGFEVHVLGVDGMWMTRYADHRYFKLQGEAYRVNRTESFYVLEDPDTGDMTEQDLDDARHLWGGYALADWRFDPQWAAGFRLDAVQFIETGEDFANPRSNEGGYTGYLTFFQSDFLRWRVQFSHIRQTDGGEDNRFYVQGVFSLGEHGHQEGDHEPPSA